MKRIIGALLIVSLAASVVARVRHIDNLLDVTWKQKGSQPIAIVVYDATTSPEWAPLVQDAVQLWDVSSAFQIGYQKVNAAPVIPGAVRVVEVDLGNQPPGEAVLTPNSQGVISDAGVVLAPADSFADSESHTKLWDMQRLIRHELGHVLTLDHHNDPPAIDPVTGNPIYDPEAQCALGNGNKVTAYDLSLICLRYACR